MIQNPPISQNKFLTNKQVSVSQPPCQRGNFTSPSTFFNDGERRIDYVLIYKKSVVESDEAKFKMISTYLNNIRLSGLHTEEETGIILDSLVCVKVHAPRSVLEKYVTSCKMELSMHNPNYKYHRKIHLKCMRSIVTCPDINDPITLRAPETLSGSQPTDFTDAERIFIVKKILSQVKYDEDTTDGGFEWLVSEKVLVATYPLHDSSHKWTTEGPLTDRQILAKYWASFRSIFKEQPLTLIERYYGPAVAFYFAWVEYYTFMLVPAALIGLVCFLVGILHFQFAEDYIVKEVCNSNQLLCPACPSEELCSFEPVKQYCTMVKLAYMVDNPITVIYSVLMSFWGVLFMILWKRKQAQFSLRWNLNEHTLESELRPNFKRKAHVQRISSITGNMEFYFTFCQNVAHKFVSYIIVFLMMCLYFLGVMAVIYYRLIITYYGSLSENQVFRKWYNLIETVTSSLLSFVIITFFDMVKEKICHLLTEFENPRTEGEFENNYSFKITVLSFGNVFFPTFYLAFFKGHFYTHPGDQTQWTATGIFKADVCQLSGCLIDLGVQLLTLMVLENAWRLGLEFMTPVVRVYFNRIKRRKKDAFSTIQWEKDFVLVPPDSDPLYIEYLELALQYGFMTFFLVSLPIAPVLALLNNIVEIRLDAIKMLRKYRRIVMRKVTGIGEWNDMLRFVTFFGTISNPLLIAFSSTLVSRYIYFFRNNFSMYGFINSTLSEFDMDDYPGKLNKDEYSTVTRCYYIGKRNSPSDPNKYEHTGDYWYHFALKSIFFIALENICLLSSLLLERLIPPIPRKVQLKRAYDERILQEERLRSLRV